MNQQRNEMPAILQEFLSYHETIKSHSPRTVDEYYLDLRNFFRYLKQRQEPSLAEMPFDEISIQDVDLEFVKKITMRDVYGYMNYLSRERTLYPNSTHSPKGLSAKSRARKLATIRSFYGYLTRKMHYFSEDPVKDMDSPKTPRTLPRYLTLDDSIHLLSSVEGKNAVRDYCILTLFLNCGLRISELIGLNLRDIQDDTIRVQGKGDKTRILYLNEACREALQAWLDIRRPITGKDADAVFLSNRNCRISRSMVHNLVKHHIAMAGLDSTRYSAHKLRHTAASLMLQNGVDVKAVQEVLGHEHLNTTEIYTHIDNDALRTAARANPLSRIKPSKKKESEGL